MSPRLLLILLVLLARCEAATPEPVPPPAPEPVALPTPPSNAQLAVVKHFDTARARELTVALAPDATNEHIEAITDADRQARAALTTLGKQHNNITLEALTRARNAVRRLETVLDQTP